MDYFNRIAISGKMASGKTTVSNFLIDSFGYIPIRSAEYLKKICNDLAILNMVESVNSPYFVINSVRESLKMNTKFIAKDEQEKEKLLKEFETLRQQFSHVKDISKKTDDVREMLQVVANVISTNIREDIWVESSMKTMDKLNQDSKMKIVHDDLRYQFEFDRLRKAGFVILRLEVSEKVQKKRVKTLYGKIAPERYDHISETDLDNSKFDYVIDADQPLINMLDEIKQLIIGSEV